MKYLCLVYFEESAQTLLRDEECLAFDDDLNESGYRIAAEALEPIHTATSIRVRNGKVFVTDGPFAETKEHLAGFYLIEARDLNDALRVASKIPPARVGTIEVRPIRRLSPQTI